MARALEFDYKSALNRATRLFWKTGYVNTSIRDLLKTIGIGEGSFYNSLKSKKHLYIECLKHYQETEGQKSVRALMDAPTASAGIRALFNMVLDRLDNPRKPSRLCMLAAMVSEDVLSEPDLRAFVEEGLENFHTHLVERLNQDQNIGLLPLTMDAQTITSVITTYLQGIGRMALVDYDRHRFEMQIDTVLSALGL
jgi:TetR/AcrR family transcriptional repressor of nem operon